MSTLKQQLYQLCSDYLLNKEAQIKQMIAEAREASANETKSSAGDKYETTRELMQQEIDQNMARLSELDRLKAILHHISPTQTGTIVASGSVVYTTNGNFYITIGAGQLKVNDNSFYAISVASPMGMQLLGKSVGYSFVLNGKSFEITNVL